MFEQKVRYRRGSTNRSVGGEPDRMEKMNRLSLSGNANLNKVYMTAIDN